MFELDKITKKKVLAQAVAVALGLTPFLPGCGGGGGGGGGDNTGDGNPGGTYSISSVGGTTTNIVGGSGGSLNLSNGRGNTEILRAGRASAQVSITQPTMDFGTNKLTVSSDATVVAASTISGEYAWFVSGTQLLASVGGSPAPNGTLYIYAGTLRQYAGNVTTDAVFTGIEIAKGVTLTINNIALSGGNGPATTLANDIYNQGTLTVGEASGQRGPLSFAAKNFFGAAGSVLTTAGDAGAPAGGMLSMDLTGGFYNAGTINVSGGSGGVAGAVDIYAVTAVANRGDINLSGGDATAGYGGNAGNLTLYGADVLNSGAITGHGGNGTLGGRGASVFFGASCGTSDGYGGDAYNEGALHLEGGTASGSLRGGQGGSFGVCSYGGMVVMNADADLRGGPVTDANGYGGTGGSINLYGYDDTSAYAGDLLVSGNLNLDGGGGGIVAGSGGGFSASVNANGGAARLALLGYNAIDVSGGNGRNAFGGGTVNLGSPAGVARNQAAVRIHSGAAASYGGAGGSFSAIGDSVENSGDIDISGDALGRGGNVTMRATTNNVTNAGALKVSGGANTTGHVAAANGGTITLRAVGKVSSSGGSYADGGNATGTGGVGGNGGTVIYASGTGITTTYSGVLSVTEGTGDTAGTQGCAMVDGNTVTGSCK